MMDRWQTLSDGNSWWELVDTGTVHIWAHSGLKLSRFGHLEKFLFLVMVAILDGRQSCRTQFWKRAIQVWSKLAQCFLRKRIKCEKLTTDDDGQTTDDERNLMVKAHMAYGQVSKKAHNYVHTVQIWANHGFKYSRFGHLTFVFLVMAAILEIGWSCRTQFWKGTT